MTGIILRKGTKEYFEANLPEEGELVYTTDTNEMGTIKDGSVSWQVWDYDVPHQTLSSGTGAPSTNDGSVDGDKYIFNEDIGAEIIIREYKKEGGAWVEIIWGEMMDWITETFDLGENNYLGQRADLHMDVGYVPTEPLDIATKGYFDTEVSAAGGYKLDGTSSMDVGYTAVEDGDVLTKNTLLQGDMNYLVPLGDPNSSGALYSDNGTLRISTGGG